MEGHVVRTFRNLIDLEPQITTERMFIFKIPNTSFLLKLSGLEIGKFQDFLIFGTVFQTETVTITKKRNETKFLFHSNSFDIEISIPRDEIDKIFKTILDELQPLT